MAKLDDKTLENLLENSEFIEVPKDFEQRILNAIDELAEVEPNWQSRLLTWLALIGGSLVSIMQMSAFIFSVWQLNNAG